MASFGDKENDCSLKKISLLSKVLGHRQPKKTAVNRPISLGEPLMFFLFP